MANINKIRLSGTTYNIQDENATKTVELTQAQYDALSTKDPNTFYIITDATGGDLSNYYTKSETSGATEISTALASKQDTLSAGTGISIVDNVISATGGGGKAIIAGRGITVTTGETADTVSFNLPISAGTGTDSIIEGLSTKANGSYSHAEGQSTQANGHSSHAEGYGTSASNNQAHAEGRDTTASGQYSHAEGESTYAIGSKAHAEGNYTIANNEAEHASGRFNVSSKANSIWGNSGNTLFSVGNGTSNSARHNAFEIRQNGDIYLSSGGTDIKLQDHLGGGGGGKAISAGTNISITTGETADTINCTLPITVSSSNIVYSFGSNTLSNLYDAFVYGTNNNISRLDSSYFSDYYIFGTYNNVSKGSELSIIGRSNSVRHSNDSKGGIKNVIVGNSNVSSGSGQFNFSNRIIIGFNNTISGGSYNAAIGNYLICGSYSETALGRYNNSVTEDATQTNYSGNTLFSIGNGSSNTARHNAFEIRQNGDIYCSDGTNDVKLQDTITATAANTTALGGLSLVKLTQAEYDALATKDDNTVYFIGDSTNGYTMKIGSANVN